MGDAGYWWQCYSRVPLSRKIFYHEPTQAIHINDQIALPAQTIHRYDEASASQGVTATDEAGESNQKQPAKESLLGPRKDQDRIC